MQCNSCGSQLPVAVEYCPACGAVTPYNISASGVSPYDLTAAPSPSGAPLQAPPATDYGSPPYGVPPPQNPYEPLNPYAVPLQAPPSPSPQRPGNRIRIIVGAVLLVLLLIGGGVLAWLGYSSARNAAAPAARATTTASANAALQHFTAKGTATILSNTTTNVRQDGQNRIYSLTVQDVSYGDITGSFTSEETSILHPDNTANFSGSSTCTCTVAGKSGTLMWSFSGTSTANGSFQGQFFDIHGTGDLAKLHGQGEFQGQGLHETYSSELYFDA